MVSPLAVCLFSFGVVVQLAYAACKLRDYGVDLTLKKLPRLDCTADSCQQLYQRNGLWCVGLHDAGLVFLGAGVFSWLSLEPVSCSVCAVRENYPRH